MSSTPELDSSSQLIDLLNDLPPAFQDSLFLQENDAESGGILEDESHQHHDNDDTLMMNTSNVQQPPTTMEPTKSTSTENPATSSHATNNANHDIMGEPLHQQLSRSTNPSANHPPSTNTDQDDFMDLMLDSPVDLNMNDFLISSVESFFPNLEQEKRRNEEKQQREHGQILMRAAQQSSPPMMQPSTPNNSTVSSPPHASSVTPASPPATFTPNTNIYIRLVKGFINSPKERQPGGKDNVKYPLPQHIIKLLTDLIPRGVDIYDLSVTATVLGFEKNKKNKVLLGTSIDERKFVQEGNDFLAKFDNLIIKYSSHLHGSKLAVRFTLLDAQRNAVCSVDTQPFATITKRGVEKRKERRSTKRKRKSDKSSSQQKRGMQALIHAVDPPCGPCSGGMMARLRGEGLLATPISQLSIRFGDCESPEVVSIKRNTIVCEVPHAPAPGVVPVSVDLDSSSDKKANQGEKKIQSDATYKYIDENSPEEVQELLQAMFKKKLNITTTTTTTTSDTTTTTQTSPMQTSSSKQAGSDTRMEESSPFSQLKICDETMEQFMTGNLTDACGFSIVHHAARRGYIHLLSHLANRLVDDMDVGDHFGRTPFMWALDGGHDESARLLFEMGADITAVDDVKDNFLHIAARTNFVESLDAFLAYIVHQDDIYCTTSSALMELLHQENEYGETPFSIAEEKDTLDMELLFENMEDVCEERLKRERTFSIEDVVLRSGEDNGKKLSGLGFSLMTIHCCAERFELMLTVNSTNTPSDTFLLTVPHKSIAFIILSENDARVEFTLKETPIVELQDAKESSPSPQNTAASTVLSRSLSFFANMSTETIQKLYPFVQSCQSLQEFKPMAFVFHNVADDNGELPRKQHSAEGKAFAAQKQRHGVSSGKHPLLSTTTTAAHQHPFLHSKTHPLVSGIRNSARGEKC